MNSHETEAHRVVHASIDDIRLRARQLHVTYADNGNRVVKLEINHDDSTVRETMFISISLDEARELAKLILGLEAAT